MSDSFTETTSKSWFKRLGEALSGIVFGIILILVAIVLLFWNEGRSVGTARALNEGAGLVVTIDPAGDIAAQSGALVHFSGDLTPVGTASDAQFPFMEAPAGSTALIRSVEMLQWRETSKSETRTKLGGGEETVTTYSYDKVWSETPINSANFKQPQGHANPQMPFSSETFAVTSGTVGRITLSGDAFSGYGAERPIVPDANQMAQLRGAAGFNRMIQREGDKLVLRPTTGGDVGTLRIGFASRDLDTLSAVGKLDGTRLTSFTASNGRSIFLLQEGKTSAAEMFADAISGNAVLTWILRVVGFVLMMVGLRMVFSVIGVAGDVIPFFGSMLRYATGFAAFAIAALVSSIVIGIAWLWYRPLLAIAIFAGGIAIAFVVMRLGRRKASLAPAAATPSTLGRA